MLPPADSIGGGGAASVSQDCKHVRTFSLSRVKGTTMATDATDGIAIGEDVDVAVVLDENDEVLGAVVDDLLVATGPDGTIVDEKIDLLDAEGNVVLEDETIDVYDAEGELLEETEIVTAIE